jgi:hypothetical protein
MMSIATSSRHSNNKARMAKVLLLSTFYDTDTWSHVVGRPSLREPRHRHF